MAPDRATQAVRAKLESTSYVFEKLWGLVTDIRNLRIALDRVRRNRGARTGGVDRVTVRQVLDSGGERFLADVRAELRSGAFRPMPVRQVLIPKAGKPGKFWPLGIPTVKDRVIQAAMKNILEPIFEAGFYPTSYGFRPGRSVHGAIAQLKTLLLPRGMKRWGTAEKPPFSWAIEGDIKGCTLENRLRVANPVLRGWANFYKHAWGAKRVFVSIDDHVWWTVLRWLRKKHHRSPNWQIYAQYTWRKPRGRMKRWRDGTTKLVSISSTRVCPFHIGWQKPPLFASTSMESPVRNERRTPGSARGIRKPRGATRG